MNSREYILHAMSLRIDALEVDVRRNCEGELILTHNPPENGREYLTLAEAFGILADKRLCINCDLKERGLEHDVLCIADECRIGRERIIFTGSLTDWRTKIEGVYTWLNPEEIFAGFYDGEGDFPEVMRLARERGYSVLNVDYRCVNDDVIALANRQGLKLSLWTIDDSEDVIVSSCVINITTNFPSRITLEAQLQKQ